MSTSDHFLSNAEAQGALQDELDMLTAMYPEQVKWQADRQELSYSSDDSLASFTLRISDQYLISALPETLTATIHRQDVRNELQAHIKQCELQVEVLDLIVAQFIDMLAKHKSLDQQVVQDKLKGADVAPSKSLTTVIWLHHLLNTNKRKQALSPSLGVSGVTKPGYPGVLIYSGPAQAVSEHVRGLRSLNWQAFQVRLEVDKEWKFPHDRGMIEVESMAEVATAVGQEHKQEFLQAMSIA